ncbi:hypothetical protein [Streptomyces sp. NPDC055186]
MNLLGAGADDLIIEARRPTADAVDGRRQDIGLPAPRDRRVALHEAPPRIRKESHLRETP